MANHKEEIPPAATPSGIFLSKEELRELMMQVAAAVASGMKAQMNPLEQAKYDESQLREQRRREFRAVLAEQEEMRKAMRNRCTHRKWPAGSGRLAGTMAPVGHGEPSTGGQLHSNETASLICTQCGSVWTFTTTAEDRNFIQFSEHGLNGAEIPREDCLIAVNGEPIKRGSEN